MLWRWYREDLVGAICDANCAHCLLPLVQAHLVGQTHGYHDMSVEVNGMEPPTPITSGYVYCDEDEDRAWELATHYETIAWEKTAKHYEFTGDHLKSATGYEYYKNYGLSWKTLAIERPTAMSSVRSLAHRNSATRRS